MWNLGSRDIIVLVSVISGCVILCNFCGALYALTLTLLFVICAWLIVVLADDRTFTPHALIPLDYIEKAGREVNESLEYVCRYLCECLAEAARAVRRNYRVHVVERMAQRRRSTYQLSADSYPSSVNTRFGLVGGLSPISRGPFRSTPNISNAENSPYVEASSRILEHAGSMSKITSTPVVPWRKEETANGDIFGGEHAGANRTPWARPGSSPQNHTLSRGEEDISYSTEGSPWGTSISPKMRARAGGVKTVQTVAGPLLASTRYNIDPKVYSDVTSPGLTSRLAKYATEANTKLTHLSQYGTGQFPRVNLNPSPTPLITAKSVKLRTPVTVRVAPPENTRYSPPERQQILSEICRTETKSAPSVVQVLKEISLKRHASREDVARELVKKQRTEGMFSEGLENLEEMTQKRARDESPRSEEELSPQNKSLRPAKRTKMPSCHDILSSLSSSVGVSSGVKRKAMDISRSGTPDMGKHFKSLDSSHGDGISSPLIVSRAIVEQTRSNKRSLSDLDVPRGSDLCSPNKRLLEAVAPPKGILKSPPKMPIANNASADTRDNWNRRDDEREVEDPRDNATAVKLTDRLFMKAEPQNIDKLRSLIEEHRSIKPRFVTSQSDEIKRSDLLNMRQFSMKAKLKSMFDAISGNAPSAINPEVVIQAEEPKVSASSTITASLTSTTSTTNINTSPIAASAIVPIIGKSKSTTTPAKHVTFQFTTADSTAKTDSTNSTKVPIVETVSTSNRADAKGTNKIENVPVADKSAATSTIFSNFGTPGTTISTPASMPGFSFSSSSLKTSTPATTNLATIPAVAATITASIPTTTVVAVTTSAPQFNSQIFNVSTGSTSLFGSPLTEIAKTSASAPTSFNNTSQVSAKSSQSPALSFLQSAPCETTVKPSVAPSAVTSTTIGASNLSAIANKSATAPAPFSGATGISFGGTPATTSMFTFGGNSTPQTTVKSAFSGEANKVSQTISFGSISTSQPAATPIAAAPTVSTSFTFSAGSAAPMKSNIFGSATTSSSSTSSTGFPPATSSTAAFSFGTNPAATSKPAFAFGTSASSAPAASAAAATAATAPVSITFGTTSNTAIPLFGAPAAATATSTTSASQSNLFGAPTTSAVGFPKSTTAPTFGATSNQSSFPGTTNTATTFGTPKTMETPAFGTSSNVAPASFAAPTTSTNLFGGVANTNASANTAATSAVPTFGTRGFGETKPPPAFGTTGNSTFAGTTGTSLFGAQPTANSTFGAPNNAATGSTSLFGTPSASNQTFGTPSTAPPAFGATNTATTTFGAPANTSAPTFGAIGTSTPAFGLQSTNAATSGNQNSTSSLFNAASPTFGAVTTAPPAFGTSISSTSGFGNTATSFGTPNNPPPAFSTAAGSSFSGFGSGSNAASPFGTQPAPGTSTFGTTNSAAPTFGSNNPNSSSFTFGAAQPTPQQQPQQSALFAFGAGTASATNNTAGGTAPFQFGNAAPQAGGFNFSGAPQRLALNFSRDGAAADGSFAAPSSSSSSSLGANSFSAPTTGGMFSIGSGSTGPRSRPSRRRQR